MAISWTGALASADTPLKLLKTFSCGHMGQLPLSTDTACLRVPARWHVASAMAAAAGSSKAPLTSKPLATGTYPASVSVYKLCVYVLLPPLRFVLHRAVQDKQRAQEAARQQRNASAASDTNHAHDDDNDDEAPSSGNGGDSDDDAAEYERKPRGKEQVRTP